ncbi:MAG: HAMP domain-containing sensor histidine kinase [Niameybacter sp.]|uniref:sensor histidine kinase n=1 Tax=Niameybacter sp. TaxID=2033640 RepID=UPI002FC934D2
MISMRKQLFALLLCVGTFTILLTAFFVNITIDREFKVYIKDNIEKTSEIIVRQLQEIYEQEGSWENTIEEEFLITTQSGKFSLSILDTDKTLIWGKTKEQLAEEVEGLQSPSYLARFLPDKEKVYTFQDIPIHAKSYGLVGYARIGYFPSSILSTSDIVFQSCINRSIIWSGLIALLCFASIGAYITGVFTKPIYAIARTSVDLAEGKYRTRYTKKSEIKEIENLRHSMNYLAQKLDEQDSLRRKLISDLSHEIRTPLHILQSNLEAMIDGIYPIDEDQMQVLYQEVVRFGSMLNNLDKLKNVEDCTTDLHRQELYMNSCIKEVYNVFKIVARERQIHFKIDLKETDRVTIFADYNALKQILMNLFSNAFKFTESGSIVVTTHIEGKMVCMSIEDTGIGVTTEDMPYIFERMYRGDKSREKYEGSGIGLTMVKKLVTLHEGKIEVESEENKGTRFTIKLPLMHYTKSKTLKSLSLKA